MLICFCIFTLFVCRGEQCSPVDLTFFCNRLAHVLIAYELFIQNRPKDCLKC